MMRRNRQTSLDVPTSDLAALAALLKEPMRIGRDNIPLKPPRVIYASPDKKVAPNRFTEDTHATNGNDRN